MYEVLILQGVLLYQILSANLLSKVCDQELLPLSNHVDVRFYYQLIFQVFLKMFSFVSSYLLIENDIRQPLLGFFGAQNKNISFFVEVLLEFLVLEVRSTSCFREINFDRLVEGVLRVVLSDSRMLFLSLVVLDKHVVEFFFPFKLFKG